MTPHPDAAAALSVSAPLSPLEAARSDELNALVDSANQALEQLHRVIREFERRGEGRMSDAADVPWNGKVNQRTIAVAVTVSVLVSLSGLLIAIACSHVP